MNTEDIRAHRRNSFMVHKEGLECRDRWRVKDSSTSEAPQASSSIWKEEVKPHKRGRERDRARISPSVLWCESMLLLRKWHKQSLRNLRVSRLNRTPEGSRWRNKKAIKSKGRKESPSPVLRSQQWCKVWWQASERKAGAQCEVKVQHPTSSRSRRTRRRHERMRRRDWWCQDTHGCPAYMVKSMIAGCICPSPHSDAYRHNKDQHPWGGASAARISNPPNEIAHGAKQKLNRDCIRKWMLTWSGSWKNGGTEEWISPSRWTAI